MTAYIELREVDMNADVNTIMTLMSMLNKTPSGNGGGNAMQTMLPLLLGMMNGGRGTQTASTSSDGAGAGGQNNLMAMLPMLMNMMRGGTPGADNGTARGFGEENRTSEQAQNGSRNGYDDRYARTSGARDERSPYQEEIRMSGRKNASYSPPSPFSEISFAGTEVRSFMETLWRIRRRI